MNGNWLSNLNHTLDFDPFDRLSLFNLSYLFLSRYNICSKIQIISNLIIWTYSLNRFLLIDLFWKKMSHNLNIFCCTFRHFPKMVCILSPTCRRPIGFLILMLILKNLQIWKMDFICQLHLIIIRIIKSLRIDLSKEQVYIELLQPLLKIP